LNFRVFSHCLFVSPNTKFPKKLVIYFLREFFEVVAMEDAKAAADGILDSLRQLVLLGLTSCDRGC